ncbi:MAG: hypothetical protein J6C46_08825 [Clostridia bacterium]|nr:hypothetical protein [Clostridia bacterium]
MKKIKTIFKIVLFLIVIFFFLTIYLNITGHTAGNLVSYILVILFIIAFGLNIYKMDKEIEEERKDDVLYADLEELKLPKFKIDEKDTWMDYTVWNSISKEYKHLPSLPFPVHIMHNDEWYTYLYYVKNVIFVNCRNTEESWWGICKEFSEGKSVYTLDCEYFEGHHDYGEIVKNNAREKEILPNTKIETKEVWELEKKL